MFNRIIKGIRKHFKKDVVNTGQRFESIENPKELSNDEIIEKLGNCFREKAKIQSLDMEEAINALFEDNDDDENNYLGC